MQLLLGSILQLGRSMDDLVKRWMILTKFRQLIERDTATISTFIQLLGQDLLKTPLVKDVFPGPQAEEHRFQ